MSDIFNSPSGVHEHHTDVSSGLVTKDKSTYTKTGKRTFKIKELKRSYVEPENSITATDELKSALESSGNRKAQQNVVASQNINEFLTNGYSHPKKNDNVVQSVSERFKNNVKASDTNYRKNLPQGHKRNLSKPQENLLTDTKKVIKNEMYSVSNANSTYTNQQERNNDNVVQSVSERFKSNVTASDDLSGKKITKVWENDKKTASVYVTDDLANKKKAYIKQKKHLSKARGMFNTAVQTVSSNVDRALKTVSTVTAGTDFLASSESYQKDTGENSVEVIEQGTKTVANKFEALAVKSNKSRYFKSAAKTSDSVKSGKNPGRFVKSVSSSKKAFSKGVNAVDSVIINPIVRIAGDDIGSQAVVKSAEIARYSVKATKVTARTTKAAVKTTGKAVRYTAQTTKKAAKATSKAVKATARVAAETAKAVAATVAKVIAFIAANPLVAIIIAGVLLLLILIIMLCSSIMATGEVSSYGGVGDNQSTVSLNDYSAVYDYTNQAIATRCRDLFNIHNTATGYLRYNYNYEIENEDGSMSTTDTYPVADIAPIMAYLAVNHQNYTLTNGIKSEIDNLVEELYTYTWETAPYSYTIDHGSGNIETISGSQLTLTICYHNAAKYFEENNILPQEKMAVYNSIKAYGDISYFRMYNILKTDNWHEWISSQYGYGLEGTVIHKDYADITEYSLVQQDYISLSYKNSRNETIDNIYSPLNGTVTSIIEDDNYDVILTIKDNENDLEFTIMSESADRFIPTVSVGSVVTAGQLIANNSYRVDFKCKANGADINPLLIMEYYPHSS